MYAMTRFKRKKLEEGTIEITEFIGIYERSLLCDPQSGARLVFTPRYNVFLIDEKEGCKELLPELSFEQVHDKYSWFFDEF